MSHISSPVLRRLVDEPMAVPDRDRRHLDSCGRCQAERTEVARDAAFAGRLLAAPGSGLRRGPGVDLAAAPAGRAEPGPQAGRQQPPAHAAAAGPPVARHRHRGRRGGDRRRGGRGRRAQLRLHPDPGGAGHRQPQRPDRRREPHRAQPGAGKPAAIGHAAPAVRHSQLDERRPGPAGELGRAGQRADPPGLQGPGHAARWRGGTQHGRDPAAGHGDHELQPERRPRRRGQHAGDHRRPGHGGPVRQPGRPGRR